MAMVREANQRWACRQALVGIFWHAGDRPLRLRSALKDDRFTRFSPRDRASLSICQLLRAADRDSHSASTHPFTAIPGQLAHHGGHNRQGGSDLPSLALD